jgi:dihydroneopterin aldolase
MTLLLVRVNSIEEAEAAIEAGAEQLVVRLDPADPCSHLALLKELAAKDLPVKAEFCLKSQDQKLSREAIGTLGGLLGRLAIPDQQAIAASCASGLNALLLQPVQGRLLDQFEPVLLRDFISACQAKNLQIGLGGAMEAPDIARLLLLEPDFLVFPGIFSSRLQIQTALDFKALALIRDLIPRQFGEALRSEARFRTARDLAGTDIHSQDTDRIFVHDLILPMSIGAYEFEHKAPQRVRINVDLCIRRKLSRGSDRHDDMRDIFSYDLIIDIIKLILGRGHIEFIETLAETIASALLAYERVATARVRIEKLDVLQACVGVEIFRERVAAPAAVTRLFSETDVKTSGR